MIHGPALFLVQFLHVPGVPGTLTELARWAHGYGYVGLQVPTFRRSLFDLQTAADSDTWSQQLLGTLRAEGCTITELSGHRQSLALACHATYEEVVGPFCGRPDLTPAQRTAWASEELIRVVRASARLGLDRMVCFSGGLCWPYFYPFPPLPNGLIEAGYEELARRWRPILREADAHGVDICFEPHPGQDVFDGRTFERFLAATGNHPRVKLLYDPSHLLVQNMDYLAFANHYHEYIRAFHVKDAEFLRNGRSGVYGGHADWRERPGRFVTPGDGQIDFRKIFRTLTENGYDGWAVLEWECVLRSPADALERSARLIREEIVDLQASGFDVAERAAPDAARNRRMLGIPHD